MTQPDWTPRHRNVHWYSETSIPVVSLRARKVDLIGQTWQDDVGLQYDASLARYEGAKLWMHLYTMTAVFNFEHAASVIHVERGVMWSRRILASMTLNDP